MGNRYAMKAKLDQALNALDGLRAWDYHTCGDIGDKLTCEEAEALEAVFVVLGMDDNAAALRDSHVDGDCEDADAHHLGWPGYVHDDWVQEIIDERWTKLECVGCGGPAVCRSATDDYYCGSCRDALK